jgi:hypothetical protein
MTTAEAAVLPGTGPEASNPPAPGIDRLKAPARWYQFVKSVPSVVQLFTFLLRPAKKASLLT